MLEAATGGVLQKKLFFRISQYLQENTFVVGLKFYLKKAPTQLFSYEYCEVFKNTYLKEHLGTTASNYGN